MPATNPAVRPAAPHPEGAGVEPPAGNARQRLLAAGLNLFADKGFRATSVRELARAAGVNVAAISYHFGDKAALYREIFSASMREQLPGSAMPLEAIGFRDAIGAFYRGFLEPLKAGPQAAAMARLHYREYFEPTGVWQEVLEREVRPQFELLLRLLQRELGLARPDRDLQRLALAVVAMAVHPFSCRDEVQALAPAVIDSPRNIDLLAQRLAGYACAIVADERERRGAAISSISSTPSAQTTPARSRRARS
jgi:AcrR family transcriptional regulator